jgi:MoaA/NifB/PqqE/SkfB family radical SAM enzyme
VQEYVDFLSSLPNSIHHVDVLGGGEPLLYPQIVKIFQKIKDRKFTGRLVTNGSFLNDHISDELIQCQWDDIRISFHAGSPNVYKKINGVEDYDRVVKNIKSFISKRGNGVYPKISLLFVMQKGNMNDVIPFAKLAQSLKVDGIEFDQVLVNKKSLHLLATYAQRKQLVSDLHLLEKTIYIPHNIPYVLSMLESHPAWGNELRTKNYFHDKYCQYVQSNIEIGSDGSVFPCCFSFGEIKAPNIRSTPFKQIWKQMRPFRLSLFKGNFLPFCYKYCSHDLEKKR